MKTIKNFIKTQYANPESKIKRERGGVKNKFLQISKIALTSLIVSLACAGIICAATTVGSNITTGGTITSTGANNLYGATNIGGALTATSTLSVTGQSNFSSNVGIGTSSPYAKLSVVGEVVGSYFTATSTTATSTFANGIYITSGCFRGADGSCITGAGTGTELQYRNGGAFGAVTGSSWNGTTLTLPTTKITKDGTDVFLIEQSGGTDVLSIKTDQSYFLTGTAWVGGLANFTGTFGVTFGTPTETVDGNMHASTFIGVTEAINDASLRGMTVIAERNCADAAGVDCTNITVSQSQAIHGRFDWYKGYINPNFYPAAGILGEVYSTGTDNTTGQKTMTKAAGLTGRVIIGNANHTITDAAAVWALANTNSGTMTNSYGVYVAKQTVGTNNYGIWVNGDSAGADLVLGANKDLRIYSTSGDASIKNFTQGGKISFIVTPTGLAVKTPLQLTANNPTAIVSGYDSAGGVDAGNGTVQIGSAANLAGIIHYNGSGTGDLTIDNSYDDATGDVIFRTRTSGTPLTNLTLKGNGSVNIFASSTPPTGTCVDGDVYYDNDGTEGLCVCISGTYQGMTSAVGAPDCL